MCWSGEPGTPGRTESTERIPTDAQIKKEIAQTKEAIKESERKLRFLENMLTLNEKGREATLVYTFGLMCFKKYRKA